MLDPVLGIISESVPHLQPFEIDVGASTTMVAASLASVGNDFLLTSDGSVHVVVVRVFEVNTAYWNIAYKCQARLSSDYVVKAMVILPAVCMRLRPWVC